jgi:hypothetical protein
MTIHRLNAYKDGHIWITYCEHCGKEADELLGSKCTGKVEAVDYEDNRSKIKNTIDKPSIDDYVARLIADNGN